MGRFWLSGILGLHLSQFESILMHLYRHIPQRFFLRFYAAVISFRLRLFAVIRT